MFCTVRFTAFVFLSCLLHLAILQFEVSRDPKPQRLLADGVGMVVMTAAQFLPSSPVGNTILADEAILPPQEDSRPRAEPIVEEPDQQAHARSEPMPQVKTRVTPDNRRPKRVAEPIRSAERPTVESRLDKEPVLPLTRELLSPVHTVDDTDLWRAESKGLTRQAGTSANRPQNAADAGALNQQAKPHYANNPPPVYPETAVSNGWQGHVLLDVLVKADGHVAAVEIEESSGYRSLDRAAQRAVKNWTFSPAKSFGRAIESRVIVPIKFSLLK